VADPPIAFLVIGVELVESSCTRRMRLSAHDEGEAPSRTAGEASASRLGLYLMGRSVAFPRESKSIPVSKPKSASYLAALVNVGSGQAVMQPFPKGS
jgi:hypothetical protein